MQNNQQLQQYAEKIREDIQKAGGYTINKLDTFDNINSISLTLQNPIGQRMGIMIYQTNINQGEWAVVNSSLSSSFTCTNINDALNYLHDQVRGDAWKNYFSIGAHSIRIRDIIRDTHGYQIHSSHLIEENGVDNGVRTEVTNGAGATMNISIKRQPNGRWHLANQELDPEGRTFDTVDSALQSLRAKLRSTQWMHYGPANAHYAQNQNIYTLGHLVNGDGQTLM
ncbi:MAG: hypothetical protein IJ590_03825 [Rickettsiales bacterium]|nr:hypothetical protein [Rickettsiales bacterium]